MKGKKIAAVLTVVSIGLLSNEVTLKNGEVIRNVKATVLPKSVRIEYEDGRVEEKSKSEIRTNRNTPVVWKEKTVPPKDVPVAAKTETAAEQKTFKNSIGMEFVLIPAGEFMMGCSLGDTECRDSEKPRHKVKISKPFYLGKFEVTQGQWKAVMGNNPSKFKECGEDCPVENVTWNDVQKYIEKLCEKEKTFLQTGKFQKCRYRLPTEAEWEYSARAGTTTKYYAENLNSIAWFVENSGGVTHPVGQKKPNVFGLYDMLGNVWEWVNDRYDEDYYSKSPDTDPVGPDSGSHRVLRGGSWYSDVRDTRASYRISLNPDYRNYFYGVLLSQD